MEQPEAASRVRVSVCVPTRHGSGRIGPLLRSLAGLEHDSFEVIVVDQSGDGATREVFDAITAPDRRFRYVASPTVGYSSACNVAAARAEGRILAFTDDDCVARPEWLSRLEHAFALRPAPAAICGGVVAAEHDRALRAIPVFMPARRRLCQARWSLCGVPLMGANLAVDTRALAEVGGFDEALGPGAPLGSGADWDLAYRLLRGHRRVLILPGNSIAHRGLRREGAELRGLLRRYAAGHGAICMKHLRMGDPVAVALLATCLWQDGGRRLRWRNLLGLRRPTGLGCLAAFVRGMARASRLRLDGAACRLEPVSGRLAHPPIGLSSSAQIHGTVAHPCRDSNAPISTGSHSRTTRDRED